MNRAGRGLPEPSERTPVLRKRVEIQQTARRGLGLEKTHVAMMMYGDSFVHFFMSNTHYYLNFYGLLEGKWRINKKVFPIGTIIKFNNHIVVIKDSYHELTIMEFSENKLFEYKIKSTRNAKYVSINI